MLQEKQNNFSFDQLDEQAMHGESPLDKTLSWQKLEAKLSEKPASRKSLWYWAAAAMLFAALISIIFLNQHHSADDAVVKSKENPVQLTIPVSPVINLKESPYVRISPLPVTEKPVTIIKQNHPVVFQKPKPYLLRDTVRVSSPQQFPLVQNNMTDTVHPVMAKTIKKLPVVHFNELQEEDRIVNNNITQLRSAKPLDKKVPKEEYAGTLNFRIRF